MPEVQFVELGQSLVDTSVDGEAPHISIASGADLNRLTIWHQEYNDAYAGGLSADAQLIREVESDELDLDEAERKVQQLILRTNIMNGFCTKCQHLLDHWPDLSTGDWAHAVARPCNTLEIEAATRIGCKFCAFLFTRLKVTGLLDTFRRIEKRFCSLRDRKTASLSIQNWGQDRKIHSQLLWLNFPGKVVEHCNSPSALAIKFVTHNLPPTANLLYEPLDQFELGKMWIRECSSSHESCCNTKIYRLPTRLISISNDHVNLVLTANLNNLPQYATLSYSWGDQKFMMLTSEKLGSFVTEIPFQELPKTFRDAIYIARKLEVPYIWIDALCIIQDEEDHNDWLKESSHMRSVYGGAYVNLAASSATNVHEGFFTKPIYYNGGFCARTTNTTYCQVRAFHIHTSEVYEESSIDTHLGGRAWTFQEKLLSPRTMYFGDHGLFWECRYKIMSEFLPAGFSGQNGYQLSVQRINLGIDRLPALSGIAARQHEVTGDQYLAGMWKENFVYQLPWTIFDPQLRTYRPKIGVPSWSWASVNSPTLYWGYWDSATKKTKEYIHVVEAWTTPVGPDAFGAVTGGELLIACSGLVYGRRYRTAGIGSEPKDSERMVVILEAGMIQIPFAQDCLEDTFGQAKDVVYMLPVFGGPSGMTWRRSANLANSDDEDRWFSELLIRGLVIQRCGKKGRFRRVGSFDLTRDSSRFDNPDTQNEQYESFMRVLETVGALTAAAECTKILSDHTIPELRYVITIE